MFLGGQLLPNSLAYRSSNAGIASTSPHPYLVHVRTQTPSCCHDVICHQMQATGAIIPVAAGFIIPCAKCWYADLVGRPVA